ncbi:hypothetical protein ACJMK2_034163 [Sinanodonta woodiana]|uniref:Arf-GAP with dual PH domain-containing protein 1 n=1 Tax=Sinanodonta woodiana TaxID=1069815 RepID=A0ABD3WQQ2_SINWO
MGSSRNKEVLIDLLQRKGNNVCADCRDEEPEWASCNLGIFLCQVCAGIHRGLGTDISRVKSTRLDNWDDDQVKRMAEIGNEVANSKYERLLPMFYKRPTKEDVDIIRQQFIKAKYQRLEFCNIDKQASYNSPVKEGYLMKKGKYKTKFQARKFVLTRQDNKIKYYNKENARQPKEDIELDDLNAVFVPEKMGNPNGLQLTYLKDGTTRNLFIYHESAQDIVSWYTAIRAAKFERRKVAFPDRDDSELAKDLTTNFYCEGYLHKMGPNNEPYKKRWFTLDKRKMSYLEEPMSPFPKGEVFIGHQDGGYSVDIGGPDVKNNQGFPFTQKTPDRLYILCAESHDDRERWIMALKKIIDTPLTPQDTRLATSLTCKRKSSFKF